MRTKKFEERLARAAGAIYRDWPMNILARMRFSRMVNNTMNFDMGDGKIARRFATYELILDDYWYLVNVAEVDYKLQFSYFGIEPDENSDICLDSEYERMVIMDALTKTIKA